MTNWRSYGDTTLTTYESEFRRLNSPMLPFVAEVYAAAIPNSRLALAMMFHEQKYATLTSIPAHYHNPLSLARPAGKPGDGVNRWMRYASWAEGVQAWEDRITSPSYKDGIYANTVTLADLIRIYAPASENNVNLYIDTVQALIQKFPPIAEEIPPVAITYGRVPHPGYLVRLISKAEGLGWDNLGQRQPKFVVLHRMIGSLWGTDGYFRMAGVNALTDYGVGVGATDGADAAGTIIRWNDPRGVRAGWASGPVNGAYGDGLAIVNKYGINAVNRDGVSIEISGNYDTAVDAKAFEEIAQLMAYWWDQMRIPHTSAPINPATGISAVIWHQEFTLGTGKVCPGKVVMDATDNLVTRATAILKQHQEGTAATTPKPPAPKPSPAYPEGLDADLAAQWFGKVTVGEKTFTFDPNGSISRLWLSEGGKTGKYPALVAVQTFGERVYYRFDNALTIWRPNDKAPARILKAA